MGTKNTLLDLNDHLFIQIERLNEEDITLDELEKELKRAKAITSVASDITKVADLVLRATEFNINFETEGKAPRFLVGDRTK